MGAFSKWIDTSNICDLWLRICDCDIWNLNQGREEGGTCCKTFILQTDLDFTAVITQSCDVESPTPTLWKIHLKLNSMGQIFTI